MAGTSLPPGTLRLRVALAPLGCRPPLALPLPGLPATHLFQTFGLLAIPLVPLPRPIRPPAPLAQANPPSQPPATGRCARFVAILATSHGRLLLPWGRPGRMAIILLGHSPIGALPLLSAAQYREREGQPGNSPRYSPPTRWTSSGEKETGKETYRMRACLKKTWQADKKDTMPTTPR